MQRKHRPFGRQSQLPSGTLTTMLGESDFSNSRLTPMPTWHECDGLDRVDEQVGLCERWRFQCRNRRSAADHRWHPVGCVPRRSGFARLALKVVNLRDRREAHTIVQAVHINDRARSGRRFRDCRDEDTATTADQKITCARSEAVVLDKRPISRPHLEQPFEVRDHAPNMAAAERACARPQRIVFGRFDNLRRT